MKKLLGIVSFLLVLYVILLIANEGARSAANHYNLGERIGLYGIISLGAGMLIITGGIDLSMGSVVGLSATLLAMFMTGFHWPAPLDRRLPTFQLSPPIAIVAVLAVGALVGLINGLLVTRLKVQAFVVTLCGLFIFRGLARWIGNDTQQGLGTGFGAWKKGLATGDVLGLPVPLVLLLGLLVVAGVFLHLSVYGRYFYAIGSNEKAAQYAGIATERYKLLAYVLCSMSAAFFGILFLMKYNSAQPSGTGNFMELYAIAGAVLGGCSLRGGEGTVAGMLVGAAILTILPNLTNMWGVPSELEFTVIGGALLLGAVLDESLRRGSAVRKV